MTEQNKRLWYQVSLRFDAEGIKVLLWTTHSFACREAVVLEAKEGHWPLVVCMTTAQREAADAGWIALGDLAKPGMEFLWFDDDPAALVVRETIASLKSSAEQVLSTHKWYLAQIATWEQRVEIEIPAGVVQ